MKKEQEAVAVQFNLMRKKLRELGYKYCRGCEDVLPLDDFYKRTRKKDRVSYSSLCKDHHKKQLKETRDLQAKGLKHKTFKQMKLF